MNLLYVKVGLAAALLTAIFGSGWWLGNSRYVEYKKAVEIAAKTQEAKVESIQKQQALVTKGIENEYNAKLAAIKSYYAGGLRQPGGSSMSGIPQSTTSIDGKATNLELACAYTTQQLVSLQDWINGQVGVK